MSYDSTDDTLKHSTLVYEYCTKLARKLQEQAFAHDESKLSNPEKKLFDKYTPKLKEMEFGSDEYKKCLAELKPALDHHYSVNRHHPEYFTNGMKGMNLIDLIEYLCDCLAATKRMKDGTGNILKSLEINQKRHGYSDDIREIMKNTLELIDETA
jgi:hypothetical protein